MGLTNPGRVLGRSCLLLISQKLLTLSGIPPFLTKSFRLASLLALLVGLNLFFLIRRACVVYQSHKSRSIQVCRGVSLESVLFPVLFSLFINDFPASLPSSVRCSLYADDLTIWSSSPRSPLWWRPNKQLCFDWSAGLSTGVFLLIRANVRPPSFQWIPTKLTSRSTSSYSAPASVSIPLQLFLWSPLTAHFSFLNMYLR